jgi:hypothetical protein
MNPAVYISSSLLQSFFVAINLCGAKLKQSKFTESKCEFRFYFVSLFNDFKNTKSTGTTTTKTRACTKKLEEKNPFAGEFAQLENAQDNSQTEIRPFTIIHFIFKDYRTNRPHSGNFESCLS